MEQLGKPDLKSIVRGAGKGVPGGSGTPLEREKTINNEMMRKQCTIVVVIFEKDCGIQNSQLLWQLTTVGGLECCGR